MTAPKHPFESLSPAHVVDAVESLGFWLPGEPFALNSYENRVFLLSDDDRRRWVAKFYRPERWSEAQIREEHAFLDELDAAGVPGAPPWRDDAGETLHHAYGFAFALFPHLAGQAPELEDPAHLFALGDLIGQVHAVARRGSFHARPVQEPMAISQASCERVLASDWLSRRQRQVYARIVERLQTLLAEQRWPETALQRVHGDCHLGNILGRDEDFALVDFDDCCMAPAVQDLWMLLTASEADEWQMQLSEVIEGYEQHVEFDRRQLRWIEPLRTLRLMRHSAWLVDRWEDPAFPKAFPWVASEGYWDQHIRILEQQRLALENPRWLA